MYTKISTDGSIVEEPISKPRDRVILHERMCVRRSCLFPIKMTDFFIKHMQFVMFLYQNRIPIIHYGTKKSRNVRWIYTRWRQARATSGKNWHRHRRAQKRKKPKSSIKLFLFILPFLVLTFIFFILSVVRLGVCLLRLPAAFEAFPNRIRGLPLVWDAGVQPRAGQADSGSPAQHVRDERPGDTDIVAACRIRHFPGRNQSQVV